MSVQEKKWQRIYDLLNAETKPKFLCRIQSKEKIFTEKELFKEKWEWRIGQKWKEGFLTALATVIKKDLTRSIRKHTNELKVKLDLSPDHNPLDYGLWGVLENKTNALPIQILVRLRLLLRENGIKYLKNLFWRHVNRFVYFFLD